MERLNLRPNERLFLVRFVGWWASHDRGERGFTEQGKIQLIRELAAHGRVLVSSEYLLPPELQNYAYNLPPEDIHHILAYTDLFVGESSTMASEACLLGTHSIYLSKTGRGVNDEQSQKFTHAHFFNHSQEKSVLQMVRDLCKRTDLKARAIAQRERMITQCIDPTRSLLDLITQQQLSYKSSAVIWRSACERAFTPSS
jgi:predicted glycosyltransferase